MSDKESQREREQFSQQIPERREETVELDRRYKSIGISAVSAATQFKARKPKKVTTDQMS